MGAYFGAFTVFIFCLLGFSANAVYITIGSSPGSDITQVSYIALLFLAIQAIHKTILSATLLRFYCA